MIILHNSQDQASRDFVAAHGDSQAVIDWYSPERETYTGPTPSAFPSVVDMDAAGGPVIVRMPSDIADAETQIAAIVAARPPVTPPVRVATARQFKAALAIAGVISEAEVTSPNLPAVAEPVVAQFPQEQRIVARSTWANMTTVPEDDPLLEAMRLAAGMTEAEKTALFDLALSIT
jgi:hypothetical protein